MKKELLVSGLILSLASTSSFANGQPTPIPSTMPGTQAPTSNTSALAGFTVGLQVGYSIGSIGLKESEVRAPFRSASTDITAHGLIGGLNLGYGSFKDKFYMGIEGSFNYSSLSAKKSTILILGGDTLNHKVKLNTSADLVARLGLVYKDNILPYVKAGFSLAQWKSSSSQQLIGTGSSSKYRFGYVLGAGCELAVSKYAIIATDYTYNTYNAFSYNVGAPGIVNRKVKIDPAMHNIMLRFKYKIAQIG